MTKESEQLQRLKHYVSNDDASLSIVDFARVVADRVADDFPREAKARPVETIEQCADRIVRQEVMACLSALVSTLAGGYGSVAPDTRGILNTIAKAQASPHAHQIMDLCEQAYELASPVDDWEEAASQAGWTGPRSDRFNASYFEDKNDGQKWAAGSWQELCSDHDIDPYQWEVFEHWAVSDWLADKLLEHGEKVDKDFANMNVWARTTTGQGISSDGVLQKIAADVLRPVDVRLAEYEAKATSR